MYFRLNHDLIIIDGEFNGEDWIELGAVRFDRNGFLNTTSGVFKSLIQTDKQPLPCLTPKGQQTIDELTGIDWDQLKIAPTFKEVIKSFNKWAKDGGSNFYLASWGAGDCFLLEQQCKKENITYPFRRSNRDIKSIVEFVSSMLNKKTKRASLLSFMYLWGVEWDEKYGKQHRALADAFNTARLLTSVVDFYSKTVHNIKESVVNL